MTDVGLKDLLRAGVHFGHQTHRWNPKMRKYIFAERGGIYLIDLKKTLHELERAQALVRETVIGGQHVLFVCTKPQLAALVQEEAVRCGSFYVTERWLGGMLTNFRTIKKNIQRLKELERGAEEGAFEHYTKKEQLLLDRERQKLERYLSGIKDMTRPPGLVYVVDAKKEEIAVREANRLDIPVVAIADTNADPDLLTVPIAGNDDAIRSVSLITRAIADAVEMARREMPDVSEAEGEAEAYTYSSDVGESEAEERPRRKKRRPRRRLRPEVIARRLQTGGGDEAEGEEAEAAATDESDGEESAEVPGAEAAGEAEPESGPAEVGQAEPAPEVEAEDDTKPAPRAARKTGPRAAKDDASSGNARAEAAEETDADAEESEAREPEVVASAKASREEGGSSS